MNSGAMGVADPFGEALIRSCEDGCCVSSRDSCAGHGGCGVVYVMGTWQDARLFSAVVGAAVYFWRRDVLFTIIAGMAVYLPLHLGWGW